MTRQQIIDAIKSNNYNELLEVYNKYKIDKKFDQFFSQGKDDVPTSHRFIMLLSRVKEIYRKLDQKKAFSGSQEEVPVHVKDVQANIQEDNITVKELNIESKKLKRVIIDSNPHIHRDQLSEEMQVLYDENGKMNQEMKSKHALLNVAASDEERKKLMDQLCELEETQTKNWAEIDQWYQDNVVDPKEPQHKKQLSPVEIAKKIDAAKNYIARYDGSKKPLQMAKLKGYKDFLTEMGVPVPKKTMPREAVPETENKAPEPKAQVKDKGKSKKHGKKNKK